MLLKLSKVEPIQGMQNISFSVVELVQSSLSFRTIKGLS